MSFQQASRIVGSIYIVPYIGTEYVSDFFFSFLSLSHANIRSINFLLFNWVYNYIGTESFDEAKKECETNKFTNVVEIASNRRSHSHGSA